MNAAKLYSIQSITRVSSLTGAVNKMVMALNEEDLQAWKDGALIQDALPYLSAEQREFLMTGITPEEWANTLPSEDDENDNA